jgi:heterodisulfide reductase subunit C
MEIAERFGLDSCIECGLCTDVCPSARNGGIVPDVAVQLLRNGQEVADRWRCLQCHRCSMVCPQSIDVAGAIEACRQVSAAKGEAPERFKRTLKQVEETGTVFPVIGRAVVQRTEFGLPPAEISADSIVYLRNVLEAKK